jgi:hypothetical protein
MADLKPIGSEKLQGQDKINRILELSRYKENLPSSINETSRVEFGKTLADGVQYEIVKEKNGYIIKKRIDESSLDYIEPMKNRTYHRSYSQALKRMNLLAGEINRITENVDEVSMFTLEEQKFTLKLPKSAAPAPEAPAAPAAPAPAAPSMDTPAPELDSPEMSMDLDSPEMGGDTEMDTEMSLDTPEGDLEMDSEVSTEPEGEEVTFKMIQKLTGKLTQKIRMMNDAMGMSSEDVKYVINSIMSALDLSKLDDEDKDDIMSKFEEDSEYGMGDDEGSFDMSGEDEFEMDTETDVEGEMGEGRYGSFNNDDWFDDNDRPFKGNFDFDFDEEEFDEFEPMMKKHGDSRWFQRGDEGKRMFNTYKDKFGPMKIRTKKVNTEMSEEDMATSHISKVMDEIFGESKVDKVLESYFVINEGEKRRKQSKMVKENKDRNELMSNVRQLSETVEQELASEFILKENKNFKFVGKTNKRNLVFEHNGEQIKVSPKGEIL